MESTDDDKEPAQTRSHDKGKRKSGRKRKRKESKKSKKAVSSDDDTKDNIQMNEIKPLLELSNSINEPPSKNTISTVKEKRSATLPRDSKQSRSVSGKRSLKDLFRRSPGPRSNRSESADRQASKDDDDIFHDASENFQIPEQPIDTADYTKYNPTLQPRNRLRYMTVQDAVKERHARRSPGRTLSPLERKILSERKDGRSSSLPDISAAESLENVDESQKRSKKPHRSKSADGLRRHNKYSRQEVDDSKQEMSVPPEASTTETAVKAEASASALETHFPSKESLEINEHVSKQNSTPTQNRLKIDLHNQETIPSSVGDRTSFAESESNSRESFNRFLHLRNNLPHFSNSSIARAQHYDSSPNEGNFNILDHISEHSRHEQEPKTGTGKSEEKGPRTYIRCPSYEEVMREKMALEKDKSQHHIPNIDSLKPVTSKTLESASTDSKRLIDSTISTSDTAKSDAHDTNNASIGTSEDTVAQNKTSTDQASKHEKDQSANLKSDKETKPHTDEKQSNKDSETNSPFERQSRTRHRGVFVSPRRFSGRSISNEEKIKATKDVVNRKTSPNQTLSLDKENVSNKRIQDSNSSQSNSITDKLNSKYSKYYSPLTSNIPNIDAKQVAKPTFKYTRSFSPQAKQTDVIGKLETVLPGVVKMESKCIQTDNGFRISEADLISIAVNTDINLSYDFSQVTPLKQIPVIVESIQESKANDVENVPPLDLPRILSARSSFSEKSAGSDNEDNLVFKTPEASPVFPRKNCASTSGNNEGIQKISDDTNKDSNDKEGDGKKEQSKPRGKLSILSIVALKRRLVRQRKLKNETVVSRQDSEVLPKKDEKDTNQAKNSNDESEDLKNKNITFIENETNISLSKLSEMNETDIIDDTNNDKDEIIFPKKHITFGKGDGPIASDEPLEDDVILRDQQLQRRLSKRRESKMIQKRKEVINCCKKFVAFLFSHIGLCSLMVAYSILGGIIFQALESPHEEKTKIKVTSVRNDILTNVVELAIEAKLDTKRDRSNLTKEVEVLLKRFQFEVYTATELHGWNNDDDTTSSEKQWSFASSLLFAITVMTTIGYGHVAPKTNYGRIVTILYAVFGIPLTLLCLTNIGDLMATGFRMLYSRVCCGVCCILFSPKRRRIPDPEKGLEHQDLVIQGEEKSPEVIHVPTSLCIVLMTSYILLGTLLFSIWEGWDVITGTYFSFITLSTIGFGDVVPGTAMDQWASEEKLVLCAMYLVFGLSLIAMCFNLVQEDVKAKCRWLGAKIGIF